MSTTLIVVMAFEVFAYGYVHQIVYTKYVLFFVCPLCFNKSVLNQLTTKLMNYKFGLLKLVTFP